MSNILYVDTLTINKIRLMNKSSIFQWGETPPHNRWMKLDDNLVYAIKDYNGVTSKKIRLIESKNSLTQPIQLIYDNEHTSQNDFV